MKFRNHKIEIDEMVKIMRSGIDFISREQRPNGSFTSLSSSRPTDFSKSHSYETTFFASQILSCLTPVRAFCSRLGRPYPPLQKVAAGIVQFLCKERGKDWSFNYWGANEIERLSKQYPNDLDDTFVALAALRGFNPHLIDGTVLAKVAKLLIHAETQVGGPYRTWCVASDAPSAWQDIDLVVNSNIGFFLSLLGVQVPNLRRFVETKIQDRHLASPYYPGIFPAAYFVSRFYGKGHLSSDCLSLISKDCTNNAQRNILNTALALLATAHLGFKREISLAEFERFLDTLAGHPWEPYAFCIDPARRGITHYAGSAALTSAFCLQTLAVYGEHFLSLRVLPSIESESKKIHARIQSLARERCTSLEKTLQETCGMQIRKTTDQEITLIPYRFLDALGRAGKTISAQDITLLSLGNLYGWMAYTIYDDFLDEEGNPKLLPAANFFLRELTALYEKLGKRIPDAETAFKQVMDTVDAANAKEQMQRKGYGAKREFTIQLADRSMGHVLPVLVMLGMVGHRIDSEESKRVLAFFRHYLTARQLHDDAHDWEADLLKGHINAVGAMMLKSRLASPIVIDDISVRLPELRRKFWRKTIEVVIQKIHYHLNAARESLNDLPLLERPEVLNQILKPLEVATEKTLIERREALKFLEAYGA